MIWHRPSSFFAPPENPKLREFLFGFEFVWDALDELENFIGREVSPNVAALRKIQGGFLPNPVAIHNGVVYAGGVSFVLRKGVEGKFKAFYRDAELPGAALLLPGVFLADDDIEIGPGVLVEPGAMLGGPTILGPGTVVRQGAYVRGSVITCSNALIGHSTEAKNTVMMSEAKAGHFAYLGDSVLGKGVNLGAGAKLANLKMSNLPFRFEVAGKKIEVKRRKFGAILGDGVATGCNCVTNPGTLMGQNSRVMPNATVKAGYYEPLTLIR
jgi:acetyltransferase-like isoleucine patch superfamily enzyme